MNNRSNAARGSNSGLLREFGPQALRDWAEALGIATFVGTSSRVFPAEMKAAPLLRAWLHRLRSGGVRFHMRHRFAGWRKRMNCGFSAKPLSYVATRLTPKTWLPKRWWKPGSR